MIFQICVKSLNFFNNLIISQRIIPTTNITTIAIPVPVKILPTLSSSISYDSGSGSGSLSSSGGGEVVTSITNSLSFVGGGADISGALTGSISAIADGMRNTSRDVVSSFISSISIGESASPNSISDTDSYSSIITSTGF